MKNKRKGCINDESLISDTAIVGNYFEIFNCSLGSLLLQQWFHFPVNEWEMMK
ncbi:hypothetical protein [Robertmurraya sp. Marseille-Q9965]